MGTPTMRGEYCEATGPDGERCIFGRWHTVGYHLDACRCAAACMVSHRWGHGFQPHPDATATSNPHA